MKKIFVVLFLIISLVFIVSCTKNEYTITYKGKDGAVIETITIVEGEIPRKVSAPEIKGYNFTGWSIDFDEIKEDTEAIALYEIITYTITYNLDDGLNASNPTSYTVESNEITLLDASKEGYTFIGWFKGETKITSIPKGSTGNIVLNASFEIIDEDVDEDPTYKLTLPSGVSANVTNLNKVKEGTSVKITVTVPNGMRTTSFKINNEEKELTENKFIVEMTSDLIVEVTFEAIDYLISYDFNGGEIIGSNPTGYTVETDTFTLLPTKKDGYNFLGWYNGETKVETVSKGSTGDLELKAKFDIIVHTITYVLDGGKNDKNNLDSFTIETKFYLLKASKEGFVFTGWFIGEEEITLIDSSFQKDITLTARFDQGESANVQYVIFDRVVDFNMFFPHSLLIKGEPVNIMDHGTLVGWKFIQGDEFSLIPVTSLGEHNSFVHYIYNNKTIIFAIANDQEAFAITFNSIVQIDFINVFESVIHIYANNYKSLYYVDKVKTEGQLFEITMLEENERFMSYQAIDVTNELLLDTDESFDKVLIKNNKIITTTKGNKIFDSRLFKNTSDKHFLSESYINEERINSDVFKVVSFRGIDNIFVSSKYVVFGNEVITLDIDAEDEITDVFFHYIDSLVLSTKNNRIFTLNYSNAVGKLFISEVNHSVNSRLKKVMIHDYSGMSTLF
ncbi:MAG: InlB B-repeat-containing protein [Acholeplasma sp.]|nr:InlB B-repeat-containing protein [Acholeplasma sp.]